MTKYPVISFDFHDTLAHCDEWFQLEIGGLLPAFLHWKAAAECHTAPEPSTLRQAFVSYREIREDVMSSGIEHDAHTCVRLVCERLGLDVHDWEIDRGLREILLPSVASATPVPGAIEAVKELAASGRHIVVISSAIYHPFLEWTLDKFGISKDVDSIVTSASCGWYKSSPKIYEHVLNEWQLSPRELLHIGDSYRFDVMPASEVGIDTILFDASGQRRDFSPALMSISDLTAAADFVLNRQAERA
ncbi:MAG: HAD family hydrolase [Chloroflexota bacterium]